MKNNPFEKHGIEHLSASSINLYISDPAYWIMKYLFKTKLPGSSAMWRGTVVDQAVGKYFGMLKNQTNNRSLTAVQEDAVKSMDDYYKEEITKGYEIDVDKHNKEKSLVPQYIKTAVDHYKQLDEIESYQEKIVFEDKSIPIPIIGYLDLKYDGVVRDIKTVGRNVKENTFAVKRQVALYGHVLNCVPIVDYIYCTKYKNEVYSYAVYDVDNNVEILKKGALGIMKLLSISDDKNYLASLFIPNFDDWRWGEEQTKEAKLIWSEK